MESSLESEKSPSVKTKKELNSEIFKRKYKKNKQNFLRYEVDTAQDYEPVLTFDLESHEWINFVVLGFYDLEADHYIYFETMKDALDYMYNYCKKKNYKTIFGHFAGKFDFNFVLDSMYRDFSDYTLTKGIPRGSGFLSMSIKRLRDENEAEGDFELTFYDSSALFPMGLAKLASMMAVETQKGSVDFRYLLKAWNGENYKNELLEDTYIDEFNEEKKRHKVFIKGKETKDKRKIRIAETDTITYYCFEDKKTYKIYSREDILSYLKDDCISLAQSINKFYEIPFISRSKKGKTIAGQAVNVLKTYLPPDIEQYIPKSKSVEDVFVREGYFGGRTEIFKHFFSNSYDEVKNHYGFKKPTLDELETHKGKTLKCFDVNSLYPTMMLNIFPLHCQGKVRGKKNYEKYKWGMWKVRVRVPLDAPIPFLGIQHTFENGSSKLCFPVGEFTGYWTKDEIEYAKTIGYEILEYYEGVVYTSADYIFKSFIEDMYAMRLKAKKEKDESTSGIVKLIMNSTYGKIGMRTDDKVFLQETVYTDFHHPDRRMARKIICGEREILLEEVQSDTSNIFHKVIIPAYVTAYARIHMHKLMLICGEKNVYYTDTDSIFTTEDMPTGDELGQLKLEYESNESVFLMPKTYSIDDILNADYSNKITMKGFDRKKVQSFTHRDLLDFKFMENSVLKAFDPEKFLTMGSAFQKGVFLGMNRSIKDELKRYKEQKLFILMEKLKAEKEGDHLKLEAMKVKEGRLDERHNKVKEVNYKEIKSKYDKRLPHPDLINTKPIILGVINGKFESELQTKKQGTVESLSKHGPSFE